MKEKYIYFKNVKQKRECFFKQKINYLHLPHTKEGIQMGRTKTGDVIYVAYICKSSILNHFQKFRAFKKEILEKKNFKKSKAPLPTPLWRRKWQYTPALLPGKSHGRRSLIGYSLWGRKESDTTERLHFTYTRYTF